MISQSKSRLVSGMVRALSSTSKICANHYDALGLTSKATQSDIKSAYYKLSKMYHPDISNDEASSKKFRAITEAYEVLGNVKSKKMYDKGLIVGRENTGRMDYQPDPEPTDPTLKFYKSRTHRNIIPTMDGKTPIYDFDAWSKNHYGELFEKAKYEKQHIKRKKEKQADLKDSTRQEAMLFLIFALAGLFFVLVVQGKSDYDIDTRSLEKSRKIEDQKSN